MAAEQEKSKLDLGGNIISDSRKKTVAIGRNGIGLHYIPEGKKKGR
jgi:hypothetical protein